MGGVRWGSTPLATETRNWNDTLFRPHLGVELVETFQFVKLSKLFISSNFPNFPMFFSFSSDFHRKKLLSFDSNQKECVFFWFSYFLLISGRKQLLSSDFHRKTIIFFWFS